jgi:hypothetical protein
MTGAASAPVSCAVEKSRWGLRLVLLGTLRLPSMSLSARADWMPFGGRHTSGHGMGGTGYTMHDMI